MKKKNTMHHKNRCRAIGVAAFSILFLALSAQSVSANPIMIADLAGNDCSGFFGQGFGSCQIWDDPDNGQTLELSPVIIKFNTDLSVNEINGYFGAVDGSEFTFSDLVNGPPPEPGEEQDLNISGTWHNTPTPGEAPGDGETFDPAMHDPGVKYWAAKAGNGFKLFWEVEDADLIGMMGPCDPSDPFNVACLDEALVVSSGDWTTPSGKNLSHLTLYDSEPVTVVDIPDPIDPIPEPATMLLLGTGLVGAAGALRRRRKNRA